MNKESTIGVKALADLNEDIVTNFINYNLDKICAICIKTHSDDVIYELFMDHETETIFKALIGTFEDIEFDVDESDIIHYHFIDLNYTLFTKELTNDRDIMFLMFGEHDENTVDCYDIIDCVTNSIIDIYHWLKMPHEMIEIENATNNTNGYILHYNDERVSLHSAMEILNEVFVESDLELNELEFTLCMELRLGMKSKWKKKTRHKLKTLYRAIVASIDDDDEQEHDGDGINFRDFMRFFSLNIDNHKYKHKWKDITVAICNSPLSKRNRLHRNIEVISNTMYEDKLNDMKILINILQELIMDDDEDGKYHIWIDSIKDEVFDKIYENNELLKIQNDLNAYILCNRNITFPKRFTIIKLINVIGFDSSISGLYNTSTLIAGYIKCSQMKYRLSCDIPMEIEEVIYNFFESYTIIGENNDDDDCSVVSELSQIENNTCDDVDHMVYDEDNDNDNMENVDESSGFCVLSENEMDDVIDAVWDITANGEEFYGNILKWIQDLENGRFVQYSDMLVNGLREYDIVNVDDLSHICSAELSLSPFNIKRFVDKRDLAQHFKHLKIQQYNNNLYEYL